MREPSSFEIYTLAAELQEVVGSFIDKIYQIGKEDILIKLRVAKGKKAFLLIRSGSFIISTEKPFPTPKKPSSFAMILRKHLENGRVRSIGQHEFDRIVVIEIEKRNKIFRLIAELFSTGNIVLVNGEGNIVMPLKQQSWSHRTIKPKELYVFPPSQLNPFKLEYKDFTEMLKESERDLVRTLARDLNLGGLYAEEILARAGIDKKDKNVMAKELDEKTVKCLFKTLKDFLEIFRMKRFEPVFVKEKDEIVDLTPIPLKVYQGYTLQPIQRFSHGLEQLIRQETEKEEETEEIETKKTLERQLERQQMMRAGFIKKAEEKKREAELLYTHYQTVDELLKDIQSILKKKEKEEDIERIKDKEIVEDFDPTENLLTIKLDNVKISLDFRKGVAENAERAYEESKKAREKAERAKLAIEDTKRRLENLQFEKTIEEKNEKRIEKKKEEKRDGKRWWFERFRWCITSEGNVVVAGKDAKTNEIVVKKYLKENDRYIHADIHGAPSCILKSSDIEGREIGITEQAIEEACQFAGVYSKAWNQFGEVSVYWVFPSQVSKTPESGEFLPKGAFVIRGKRNYKKCKMEMAVGEVFLNGIRKIMAGSLTSVRSRSSRYVVIQPGEIDKNSFAKRLARVFDVPVESILHILPPGDVDVLETKELKLEE